MSSTWQEANFKQAKSDYAIAQWLWRQSNVPHCHVLHFLQMSTEKLARSFLYSQGQQPQWSHKGLVKFIRSLKREKRIGWEILGKKRMGFSTQKAFENFLDSLLPLAKLIEELAPTLAGNSPNPEYPWLVGNEIIAPVEHDFSSIMITNGNQIKKFMDFFLETIFDSPEFGA